MKEIKDKKIYKVKFSDSTHPVYYYREPDKTKDLLEVLQKYQGCILVGKECALEFIELILVLIKDYNTSHNLRNVVSLTRIDNAIPPGLAAYCIHESGEVVLRIEIKPVLAFEA